MNSSEEAAPSSPTASSGEPTPSGNTEPSQQPSGSAPSTLKERTEAMLAHARVELAKAMAEAERRGVPLHEIIPVH